MTPKDDENEMSMEEILASIKRYVSDDEPETNQSGIEYSNAHTAEVIRLTESVEQSTAQKRAEFTPFARVQERAFATASHQSIPDPKVVPISSQPIPQREEYIASPFNDISAVQKQQETPSTFTPPIHEPGVILPFQKGGYAAAPSSFTPQQPAMETYQEAAAPQQSSAQNFSDVITEKAMHSTSHAFSKLSEAFQMAKVEKQHHDAQKNHGASAIESFVIELAKPMVRQWIDEHLPSLVDRLVTQEIEKLTEEMRKKLF